MKICKLSFTIACLFALTFLHLFHGKGYGWGFFAHKWISRLAIEGLPDEIRPFFLQHKLHLAEHSIDPDLWRNNDPEEAVRHYIDIDMYGIHGTA